MFTVNFSAYFPKSLRSGEYGCSDGGSLLGKKPRFLSGDLFLVAVLIVNFIVAALLLGWMRADLMRDLVASEARIVSSKIDTHLWGKILLFTAAVENGGERAESLPFPGAIGKVTVTDELPSRWNFQRLHSGTGEWLPVYLGVSADPAVRGSVLRLAFHTTTPPGKGRFVSGDVSAADIHGDLRDLEVRGVFSRIVDFEGASVFGSGKGITDKNGSPIRPMGTYPLLSRALSRDWSVEIAVPDAGTRLPILPQAVLFSFFLLNAFAIVYIRQRYLKPSASAVAEVSKVLASQGELLPDNPDPGYVVGAVQSLLARSRNTAEEEKKVFSDDLERRIRDLSESQKQLVAHHRITKKMLQCRQSSEVFQVYLSGIVDSYGFHDALIGTIGEGGYLQFHGEPDPLSGVSLKVPLWNPQSLLARTFWSGSNCLHESPTDIPHIKEEEIIIGYLPVLLLPLMKNIKVRCAETKHCGDQSCPNFFSENMKCWVRYVPKEKFTADADPETFRESVLNCLSCEVFPPAAIVVVRSDPDGKAITRENAVSLTNLASEASLALEVVSLYDNMKIMAVTDGLTGLFNHKEFYQRLRRELERARRYRHTLSLLMIDVDDFKQFNDRFGHPAGDSALRDIAIVLRKCARATDIIARYGGEEFSVILPESTPSGALMVAERIKTEISAHNFIQSSILPVCLTVSIGIFSSDCGNISEDQIVSYADEASYTAKKNGKNQVVVRTAG